MNFPRTAIAVVTAKQITLILITLYRVRNNETNVCICMLVG